MDYTKDELVNGDKKETFFEFTERTLDKINAQNWDLFYRLNTIKGKLQNDLEPKEQVNEQQKLVTLPQKIEDKLKNIGNSQTEMNILLEIIERYI